MHVLSFLPVEISRSLSREGYWRQISSLGSLVALLFVVMGALWSSMLS
jgi:hypothetical protein